MGDALNRNLIQFIGSGLMDYAYSGSEKYNTDLTFAINPLGCSKVVSDYMKKTTFDVFHYPEVVSDTLRVKIAETYNLNPDRLLVGAGVVDLIHISLLSIINPGDTVLIPEITFPTFEFVTILVNGSPKFIPHTKDLDLDYDALEELLKEEVKVVILCNPNNPTGIQLDPERLTSIMDNHQDTIFFIDEANVDLGGESLIDFAGKYDNTFVFRSFSKGFGLAGLRVGFQIGNSGIMQAIKRRQPPFTVNSIAQEVAQVALEDMAFLDKSKKYVLNERMFLEDELTKLGYKFVPSDSNYLLINTRSKSFNSTAFVNRMNKLNANAVDGSNFRGLSNDYVRISPRKRDENQRFIDIVKKITPA